MSASGVFSGPLYELRRLVASSSTFQTWVGATTGDAAAKAAAALLRVYRTVEPETGLTRPFALVGHGQELNVKSAATSSGPMGNGQLYLMFQQATPEAYLADDAGGEEAFMDTIGAIINDMMSNEGRTDYLVVRNIGLGSVSHSEESEPTKIYQCECSVDWGLENA